MMGEPGALEAGGDAGCSRGSQKGESGIEMGSLGVRQGEAGNDKAGSGVVARLGLNSYARLLSLTLCLLKHPTALAAFLVLFKGMDTTAFS
jgi:hypothetical protein